MYLTYNKPSFSMNYPKSMEITKKTVMKERNKMKYPKAWNYMKTKTGGHRLKFSQKQFKKYYLIKPKQVKYTDFGYKFGDYY